MTSDSSPSSLDLTKPSPRYLSYRQAMAQYRFLCDALRQLGELQLQGADQPPADRAALLALTAILKGEGNGSA